MRAMQKIGNKTIDKVTTSNVLMKYQGPRLGFPTCRHPIVAGILRPQASRAVHVRCGMSQAASRKFIDCIATSELNSRPIRRNGNRKHSP